VTPVSFSKRTRSGARGYTFVELLMSLAVLSIGVTGIVAMQKTTMTSNQHAKNLAIATQIAQAWTDALHADAIEWNHPSTRRAASDLAGDTVWLSTLAGTVGTATDWFRPTWDTTRQFGPGFDIQGKPVDTSVAASVQQVRFCTNIRLSWLHRDTGATVGNQRTTSGNGLIRAEVRVFWVRDGQTGHVGGDVCGGNTTTAVIGAAATRYHFVYQVSAVRQNTAQ
jgi:prepilin-type N-terminal cleavage/methylation domain-containing protein